VNCNREFRGKGAGHRAQGGRKASGGRLAASGQAQGTGHRVGRAVLQSCGRAGLAGRVSCLRSAGYVARAGCVISALTDNC